MKYTKEEFMSVLNQVKTVCVYETDNRIFRQILSEESNEDAINSIKNTINNNNCNFVDEVVKLARLVESITHNNITEIINDVTSLFISYNPKYANAAYDIANSLLKYPRCEEAI